MCLTCLIAPAATFAHDFWIEPSTTSPEVGEVVEVGLRVGDHFQGEPIARIPTLIDRFIVVGPNGEQPIPGVDGRDPAGLLRIDAPGSYILGYRSKASSVTLEAAKFAAYLKEEGLEHLSAVHGLGPTGNQIIRENFSRCAKALLKVGESESSQYSILLGFTLELVPLSDPNRMRPGDKLTVQLLLNGQPLEGATIRAMKKASAGASGSTEGESVAVTISARSDANGHATFQMNDSGFWMIKAVHLQVAPADTNADYESLWASLTFELSAS